MRIKCHPAAVEHIPHCWQPLPVETRTYLPRRYIFRVHDDGSDADMYKLKQDADDSPLRAELDALLGRIEESLGQLIAHRDGSVRQPLDEIREALAVEVGKLGLINRFYESDRT